MWMEALPERTELSGPRSRAHLVVLAGEIGRWSEETRRPLSLLAKAKPPVLRKRFAVSLLLRFGVVLGDVPSTHEVVNDLRHAGHSFLL